MVDYGFKGVPLLDIRENQCTHIILVFVRDKHTRFILELGPLFILNPISKAHCIASDLTIISF